MTGRAMTESEAVDVWCPWSIGLVVAHDDRTLKTANRTRNGDFPLGCHCLGAKCAAWVWVHGYADEYVRREADTPRGACGNVKGGEPS